MIVLQYKIPLEIGSELKLNRLFYLKDLLVVLILGGIGFTFRYVVHPSLVWYYTLFWIILTLSCLIRPKTNPGLRMGKTLFLAVIRNRVTYCAMDTQKNEKGDH
ncbi:DUF5592 family protein [Pseudalkalibacillus hwajinpoensis]|uniref:DUF5592 family protein n=1 Tax=Guptibacillus hwajinpoensis TaxID=208199 RepID=UPI00325A7BED